MRNKDPMTLSEQAFYQSLVDYCSLERVPANYNLMARRLKKSSASGMKKIAERLEEKGWVKLIRAANNSTRVTGVWPKPLAFKAPKV